MDFYEYIEAYKQGTLDQDLREQMEAAMANDSALRKAVDNYDHAKDIAQGLLEIDIMQTIQQLQENKAQKSSENGSNDSISIKDSRSKIVSIPSWLIAASLIGIIALAAMWFLPNNTASEKERLWAELYQPAINKDLAKSGTTKFKDEFVEGKHYASLNDYEKSNAALNNVISNSNSQDTIQQAYFWLAHNYLKTDRYDEAITAFEKSKEESSLAMIDLARKLKALEAK